MVDLAQDFPLESRPPAGLVFGVVNSQANESEGAQPLSGVKVNAFVNSILFDTTFTCADGRFGIAVPGTKGVSVRLEFEAEGFEMKAIENPDENVAVDLTPKIFVSGFIAGRVRIAQEF